jgi:hypothetical protein
MKKIQTLIILFLAFFTISSCEEKEPVVPSTPTLSQRLQGTWRMDSIWSTTYNEFGQHWQQLFSWSPDSARTYWYHGDSVLISTNDYWRRFHCYESLKDSFFIEPDEEMGYEVLSLNETSMLLQRTQEGMGVTWVDSSYFSRQ